MKLFLQMVWNYFWLVVVLPVVVMYLRRRYILWVGNKKREVEKQRKDYEIRQNSHSNVLLCDNSEYYLEAKRKFNTMMRNGLLNKKEIFYLRNMINMLLGENVLCHYKGFKFKNEANEIYVKLKNQYLEISDYQEIIGYLDECFSSKDVSENDTEEESV